MKKILLIAVALGMGWVTASHAVVISWAAETDNLPLTYQSAQLVYIGGDGTWTWSGYTKVGTLASGGALAGDAAGVYEQSADTALQGTYYVVLFSDAAGQNAIYRSWQSLSYDNDVWDAITFNIMNPAGGVFLPSGGVDLDGPTGWEPIPEPSTFALLAVGAAAIVWKRRRKS